MFRKKRTEAVLYALARGADAGTIIFSEKALINDAAFASLVLATYLSRQRFDMILCGNESIDTGMACMGPFIADHLGLPHVTRVVSLDLVSDETKLIIQRRLEKGNREKVECPLPAVVAVDPMVAPLRYASVYGINNAAKHVFELIPLDALGLKSETDYRTELRKVAPPRPAPRNERSFPMQNSLRRKE